MPSILMRSRRSRTRAVLSLFIIFQLSFYLAHASNETIEVETGSHGLSVNGADFGNANPCSGGNFVLFSFVVPAGYSFQKAVWYGNNAVVATSTSSSAVVPIIFNSTTTNDVFTVFAQVFYVSGTSTVSSYSNSISIQINPMGLNSITSPPDPNLGCASPLTFSTSPSAGSSMFPLYAPPTGSYTISWTLPPNWTFSGASTGNSITAIPDATDAGNIVATLTLGCGFHGPSTTHTVTRPSPAPTFFGLTEPVGICNNSTNTFSINPQCGASSYIYTLSGNAGATFQANGTQSLTTSASSVVVSAGTVGNSSLTLSVQAVYPGGTTSSLADYTALTGAPPEPSTISPATETVAPNQTVSFVAVPANHWSVGNGTILTGQGTDAISVKVANVTSGTLSIVASAQNACGIGPIRVQSYPISSGGGGFLSIDPGADSVSLSSIAPDIVSPETSRTVSPNPATNNVRVFIPQTDFTKTYIKLYDINGRLLQVIIPNNESTTIDLSQRAKGTYIVTIFDGKQLSTKKLIKQ